MGKSSKATKRNYRKPSITGSSAKSGPKQAVTGAPQKQVDVAAASKKSKLKSVTSTAPMTRKKDEKILGGVDYVDLMMGSRTKAKAAAAQGLPI